MQVKKIPMRMCIACKTMLPKKEMLRIVKNKEGEIVLDRTGKVSGRGAYICGNPECLKKLVKNKLLNRVFETEIPSEVYVKIEEEFFGN